MENAREKKQQASKAYSLYDVQAQVEMHLFQDRLRLVYDFVDSREPRKDPLDEETETIQQLRFYLPDDCKAALEMLPKEKRYPEVKRMILSTIAPPRRKLPLEKTKLLDNARMHELKRTQKRQYLAYIGKKFKDWVTKAKDPSHWITWHKLPSMFRFAMQRVAMPQGIYWSRIKSYGLNPNFDELENEEKWRLGRERTILLGAERAGECHVSLEYKGYLPKGLAFLEQQGTRRHEGDKTDTNTKYKRGFGGAEYSHEGLGIINLLIEGVRDFRNQQITRQGFYDIIGDQLDGLSVNHAELRNMLDDDTCSPEWIGETIWEDAVEDTSLLKDNIGDNVSEDTVAKSSPNLTSNRKVPSTLRLNFSIGSRFRAIHADVMTSVLPLEDAPSRFRDVLGLPNISDRELSIRLHENSIPADCYFGVETTAPESKAWANIANILQNLETSLFSAPKANNTFGDPSKLTPDNSRRESFASDSFDSQTDNYPSRPGDSVTRPATPPSESPSESFVHNPADIQKLNDTRLADSEVLDGVEVIDVEIGEASDPDDTTMSNSAMSYEKMSSEDIGSTDQSMSFLPDQHRQVDVDIAEVEIPADFSLMDWQGAAAAAMPPPQNRDGGMSRRARTPHNNLTAQNPTTSRHPLSCGSPMLPSPKRQLDWSSSMSGTASRPFDDDYQSENLSVSPEQGNTKDLWGISMPTRRARQLGTKIGLPGEFIDQRIRSLTPRRASVRKFKKETLNTTIPRRKRKASPLSSRHHRRVRQKLDDGLFAEDGEDHRAFLHRSIYHGNLDTVSKSTKPEKPKKLEKRCEGCDNTKCICIRDFSLESFHATPSALDQGTGPTSRAFGSDSEALQELDRLASKLTRDDINQAQNKTLPEAQDTDNDTWISSPTSSSQHLEDRSSQSEIGYKSRDKASLLRHTLEMRTPVGNLSLPPGNTVVEEQQAMELVAQTSSSLMERIDGTKTDGQPNPVYSPEDDAMSISSEETICAPQPPTQTAMSADSVEPDRAQRMSVSSAVRGLNVVESSGWSCLQAPPPTPRPAHRPVPQKISKGMTTDLPSPRFSKSSDLQALDLQENNALAWQTGDFPLYSSAAQIWPRDAELQKATCEDNNSESVTNPSCDPTIEASAPGATRDRVPKKHDRFLRKAERARRTPESQSSVDAIREITKQDRINAYISMTPAVLEASRKRRNVANSHHKYSYFHTQNASLTKSGPSSASNLSKQFDKYRDDPRESPDTIGIEGSIKYLGDLGVNLDEVAVLAVLTELSAPTMGELTREAFIAGWKSHNADTLPKQQAVLASLRHNLATDHSLLKRVYRHTFLLARNPGQKAIQLDSAIEYWRLLLQSPSRSWNTLTTPWLSWWIEYLEAKWKKSVNRDMWDQTGEFVMKSLADESMSWWSEDGAWPGVLDEFVAFVEAKRGQVGNDAMEIE